jgi:hypothetical protein
VKWPEYEANYSPPSSAEVKNAWRFVSTPEFNEMHISVAIFTLNSNASSEATSTLTNK